MNRQLHAGQLRYHDFAKLRDARRALDTTSSFKAMAMATTSPSTRFINTNAYAHAQPNVIQTQHIQLSSAPTGILQSRPFISAATLNKHVTELNLKKLERTANQNPTNVQLQYEFLSELLTKYPEAVITRFEKYPQFAIDENVTMLYFSALQKTNSMDKFHLSSFNKRLLNSNAVTIDPLRVQSLKELESQSRSKKSSKGTIATEVMQILADGRMNAPMGAMGSMGGGATLGGVVNMLGGGGMNPGSEKNPLQVQLHTSTSTRVALLNLVRQVTVVFILCAAVTVLFENSGLGGGRMGMGSQKHLQEAEGSDVRFDDVKGVDEAKADLEEIVEYLKNPEKFTRLGGKLPRGLLLTGPPGTGKTLLVKAIAGEAGVPFFFSSGSQFEEVYVGLGAKRIRELFEEAKKKSPAIIFIDEIDAVGGTRKLRDQSALKMTLNELLVQMDGFDENNGVIVIGATNFAEALDEALTRPGRFDKQVVVPLPDVGGRKEILELYAKKTKLSKDVDLSIIARGTVGFTGADLFNLINQAALKASTDGLNSVTMAVLEYAKDKILMGAERRTAVITPKTAKCTAYHEAGHALIAVMTDGAMPVHKATIMPRGQALGMVSMLPEGDQTSRSFKEMHAMMDVAMGGRVAEELIFGAENVTSGASSDIQNATGLARAMVTKYGFSNEVGIVFHGGNTGEQSASSETRAKIDTEVKRMTDSSYNRAKDLLRKYSKQHHLLAQTLLEYETLTGDEVRDIVLKNKKPSRPIINKEGGARGDRSVLEKSSSTTSSKGSKLTGLRGKVGSRRDSATE